MALSNAPLALAALTLAVACGGGEPSTRTVSAPARPAASDYTPPPRSKESGCVARGALPDPSCTPGAVMTRDRDIVCKQSTRARRHVSEDVHRLTFAEYGIPYPPPASAYEVDHLIPLALGGDNAIANLWPEQSEPQPGFHEKDTVEDHLHREVCAGRMSLADAQRAIATDWSVVYRQIQGTSPTTRGDDREGD
ncbi:MAG: HNH endonuclease signature motif containing protein [Polyangiaceae bacterium]